MAGNRRIGVADRQNTTPPGDDNAREVRRILERVERDSETIGTSSLARTANRARDHFGGADADRNDRVEVWGRRIGRALSLAAFVGLAIWLFNYLGRH